MLFASPPITVTSHPLAARRGATRENNAQHQRRNRSERRARFSRSLTLRLKAANRTPHILINCSALYVSCSVVARDEESTQRNEYRCHTEDLPAKRPVPLSDEALATVEQKFSLTFIVACAAANVHSECALDNGYLPACTYGTKLPVSLFGIEEESFVEVSDRIDRRSSKKQYGAVDKSMATDTISGAHHCGKCYPR